MKFANLFLAHLDRSLMEVGMILVPAVKIRSFELEPEVVKKQHAF